MTSSRPSANKIGVTSVTVISLLQFGPSRKLAPAAEAARFYHRRGDRRSNDRPARGFRTSAGRRCSDSLKVCRRPIWPAPTASRRRRSAGSDPQPLFVV